MKEVWSGTGTALITPFRDDLSPDLEALSNLVVHAIDHQLDYLVILGTTAETPTLTKEERHAVARTAVEANTGRIPMMLGIGGNDTRAVLAEMQQMDLSGFQSILSVTPYYNRPSQEGLFQHFRLLSEASPLPLMLYNVPPRTGINMAASTTARLARECPGIIGIKEAVADLNQVRQILKDAPEDFVVVSGDDFTAMDAGLLGADGVISVLAQALPRDFSDMIRFARSGEAVSARAAYESLRPFCELIFREGNPTGIKALLAEKGFCSPVVRMPLQPASEGLHSDLREALHRFSGVKKD